MCAVPGFGAVCRVRPCIYMHIRKCVCVCLCVHAYEYTYTYIHIHARTHTHARTRTRTHTHACSAWIPWSEPRAACALLSKLLLPLPPSHPLSLIAWTRAFGWPYTMPLFSPLLIPCTHTHTPTHMLCGRCCVDIDGDGDGDGTRARARSLSLSLSLALSLTRTQVE
jgi:hypothetical protein